MVSCPSSPPSHWGWSTSAHTENGSPSQEPWWVPSNASLANQPCQWSLSHAAEPECQNWPMVLRSHHLAEKRPFKRGDHVNKPSTMAGRRVAAMVRLHSARDASLPVCSPARPTRRTTRYRSSCHCDPESASRPFCSHCICHRAPWWPMASYEVLCPTAQPSLQKWTVSTGWDFTRTSSCYPGIGAYHGNAPIPDGSSYPVRHGFAFEVITDTLEFEPDETTLWQNPTCTASHVPLTSNTGRLRVPPASVLTHATHDADIPIAPEAKEPLPRMQPVHTSLGAHPYHEDETAEYLSFVQLSFQSIHKAMTQIQDGTVQSSRPSAQSMATLDVMTCTRSSGSKWHDANEDTTQIDDGPIAIGPEIIHRWQHLAALRPPAAPRMAPIITWMIDHERFPQCFQPREVYINLNPNAWQDTIKRAWQDVLLPNQPTEIALVQPHPISMEAHAVAHVLITQQQHPGFTSILLTTLDSAMPHAHRRHATMVPAELRRDTVLALAFIAQDCSHPHNECDTWIGDVEMDHIIPYPITLGQSCTAALHRHNRPDPQDPNPWEASVPVNKEFRVQLHLQASIPMKADPLPVDATSEEPQLLWFANEAWKLALEAEEACTLLPLPEGLHVPDPSYWALLQPPPNQDHGEVSYTLYLDGAANGTDAGWSVIVVANQQHTEHFLGCTYGTVQLNPQQPDWVGAETADNISAELSAMLFAQNMVMRWQEHSKACIRPDLSLSRTVATAVTTCRSNQLLAQLCCALGLWLSRQVDVQEVRGHKGHAWNELADAVAKWAMQQHSNPLHNKFGQLHQLASNPHDVKWTWMQTTHPAVAACFPPILQQQVMQFTKPSKKLGVLPTERLQPTDTMEGSPWHIQMCTANVLATELWSAQQAGSKRTGQRTLRLDAQWHNARVHIIGIQEARTAQGRFHAPQYHILASGAKHKRAPLYGCELWVHKTLPVATDKGGQPVILGKAVFTVQHADPRRLLVEAKLGLATYAFIVLHAPSLATPSQENPDPIQDATQWWTDTSAIYTQHVTASDQWVFIDANAPLACGDGDLIGTHGAESANKAGELLVEFIEQHQLVVPSTFPHLHQGPTATWTHSTGKKSRKDYVLVSRSVYPLVTSSWVDVMHDTTFAHEDHLPVFLQCQGWLRASTTKPPLCWDDQAMLDPDRLRAFQSALHTLPLPTWDTQVDDHAAIFERQLLTLGQQFFAKQPGKQRLIQLTPSTKDAIAFKRHILDYGRKQRCMHHEDFKVELRLIEKEVARRVCQDIQLFYTDLLAQLQSSGEISNQKLVYKLLHRLGRKKGAGAAGPRPLPMLQKPDGTMAQSYLEQQQTWMKQFSQIEAGIEKTWEEMTQQHEAQETHQQCTDLEPVAFPCAWQIQQLISRLKRDKVPGPNQLPPGLFKAGGSVIAKHLSALFTKVAAGSKEPMHWKGGVLIPLWKGKLPPHVASGYRSIFLSNYTTKLYHQSFRAHLVAAWENSLTHLQCGGRKGVGADVAHHIVQCHQSWCKQKAVPSAALFFDLKSAFYMVLRQSFTSLPSHDEAFMEAMKSFGLTPREIHQLVAAAQEDNATPGLATHLQHVLRDLMQNTYFTVAGILNPCQTTRGTRPGDPVADVLFNLCMCMILRDFRQEVEASSTIPWLGDATPVTDLEQIPSMPAEGFVDVTFVDDCVVLLHGRTNDRVAQAIQLIVTALDKASAQRGLSINFDQGKTEVLWTIIGKGAREQKRRLHEAGQLLTWHAADKTYTLHVCQAYKHLGTWVQAHHRHAKEALARAAAAKQQWGQLAQSFFTKKAITIPVKSAVFQSLVVSKMTYNVHTWTSITQKQLDSWVNHLKAPAGTLLKGLLMPATRYQHTTDEMMAFAGLLPLQDQVHANRLRFLARLLQACPKITWTLLHATKHQHSWIELCFESCQWLLKHYDRRLPLTEQSQFLDWVQFVRLDPNWKGRIKKTCKLALSFHRSRAEHVIWQRHFNARLIQAGATLPDKSKPAPMPERWQCDLCQKVFASTRALAMHATREHGYKKKVRYYATGDTCQACCQNFHTRKRLSVHLEKQARCYNIVTACWPPLPATDVQELDDEDRIQESQLRKQGWWAAKAFQPVMTVQGPPLPPAGSPEAQLMFDRMQLRRPSDVVAYTQLQGTKLTNLPRGTPKLWWTNEDLPAFIMHSVQGPDAAGGAFAMWGLARETAALHIRALVVVHFFSGYRRMGDIHHVVDHYTAESGYHMFTLSVDLCMQRQSGDLATPQANKWWKERILSGQVVAAGGGPPCETFTVARQYDGGPRPLRSAQQPHGLPGLTENGASSASAIGCCDSFWICW